ncbi:MAG TPA: hypothetical protein VGJ84_02195 [Polyangiaceae bacterium]
MGRAAADSVELRAAPVLRLAPVLRAVRVRLTGGARERKTRAVRAVVAAEYRVEPRGAHPAGVAR